jgi:NADH dehydrogenase
MILVAGATGSLGGKIVGGLLARGDAVRALVRAGSAHQPLEDAGAKVVRGDLRDPESLRAACHGVDVVISTASATNRSDDSPENVDARGTQNLIEAARQAGVTRFVLVSTLGASPDSPVPAFRAKAAAEAALHVRGMEFTILQPNAFMDVWFGMLIEMPVAQGQPVTLVGESRRRHSFIAEHDVMQFALAATRQDEARNQTLVIGGPSAITLPEVVAAYEAVLGRRIPIRFVAPGAPIPGLPEPVWGIAAALETFDSILPMESLARTYHVTLTSAAQFAAASRLAATR